VKIKRKLRRAAFIPTASFGDIAFLLNIFFMVGAVFLREAHISNITPPKSQDVSRVRDVTVSVVYDGNGDLWLQGLKCSRQALEPEVTALLQGQSDKTVFVKIDRDRPQQEFGDILLALGEAGADVVLIGDKEGK
jgi:biopolymer transport protein ExbD